MSRRKRLEESPMPASSAGLLRFYQGESGSKIKLSPEIAIVLAAVLVIAIMLANLIA
jgi:preprotein translocase subunit Sec61beta